MDLIIYVLPVAGSCSAAQAYGRPRTADTDIEGAPSCISKSRPSTEDRGFVTLHKEDQTIMEHHFHKLIELWRIHIDTNKRLEHLGSGTYSAVGTIMEKNGVGLAARKLFHGSVQCTASKGLCCDHTVLPWLGVQAKTLQLSL